MWIKKNIFTVGFTVPWSSVVSNPFNNQTFGKICLAIWRMTFHIIPWSLLKRDSLRKKDVVSSHLSGSACQRCTLNLPGNSYHILPCVSSISCSHKENSLLLSHRYKPCQEKWWQDRNLSSSFMSPSHPLEE